MSTQINFSERLKSVRKACGATQEQFAAILGFTRSYVSQLEAGTKEPGSRFVSALEGVENRSAEWLGLSKSAPSNQSEQSSPRFGERKISIQQIPVISWAHAGEAATYEELPKDWQETVPSTCRDADAFGLIIEGDSMQPNYQPSTVLIVMPSREPRNGCLVVAKLKKNGVVFRRFNLVSEDLVRLTAYNPMYAPYEGSPSDFHWIYPVHSIVKTEW